jgi:tRNA threonylcarbamoyladenosine biosynthesis protein TsaE
VTTNHFHCIASSPEVTAQLGAAIADWLQNGDVLLLHGDLGAGKTTLTKGIAAALGIDAVVSSPSFALINEYDVHGKHPVDRLYHLDLYRLQDERDLDSIGFAEYMSPNDGASVVEWPERATNQLPRRYILIEIEHAGENTRSLSFLPVPSEDAWAGRFSDLKRRLLTALT